MGGNVSLALGEPGWEGAAESQAKVVEAETALLGKGTAGSLCPVITILTLDGCLSTGAYSSACVKCYKLNFSIPGVDFRLLVLSKRKFQLEQVSFLQNRN